MSVEARRRSTEAVETRKLPNCNHMQWRYKKLKYMEIIHREADKLACNHAKHVDSTFYQSSLKVFVPKIGNKFNIQIYILETYKIKMKFRSDQLVHTGPEMKTCSRRSITNVLIIAGRSWDVRMKCMQNSFPALK